MKKILIPILAFALVGLASCDFAEQSREPMSSSGVKKATTTVQTDLNGKTIEQNNIIGRYAEDNKPGSIKHLYVISAYSGEVLMYSTVKGKITSSGKRLTPTSVLGANPNYGANNYVSIGNNNYVTDEVIQDDGTYGSSIEYVYWWDSKGVYHQQFITGGMILHVSNQPVAVKSVTLNLESR